MGKKYNELMEKLKDITIAEETIIAESYYVDGTIHSRENSFSDIARVMCSYYYEKNVELRIKDDGYAVLLIEVKA